MREIPLADGKAFGVGTTRDAHVAVGLRLDGKWVDLHLTPNDAETLMLLLREALYYLHPERKRHEAYD